VEAAWLEPGAREALAGARAAGFATALWTNNAREVTQVALDRFALVDALDLVVTRDEMAEMKPSADGWRVITARFASVRDAVVVGQEHLLGPGRVLRAALERGELHSMILWGPPGSGKTTLASLMAHVMGARFVAFSAVLSGVKEIRQVVAEAETERARRRRGTILFVDEIHRFNRGQQDAFLPHVEK